MKTDLRSLELTAMDLDHSVIEAEKAGDEMEAARLTAKAIMAWAAYWQAA